MSDHDDMTACSVGICEDDAALRSVLLRAVHAAGYETQVATTGRDAVRLFGGRPPDVLVLDIGLPDSDGRDVCQALRAQGMNAPVIFLTAREALTDRLSGFHAGGDDYLTKPFELAELLVRIDALLRRAARVVDAPGPPFRLDPITHAVHMGDQQASLTPTEFRLLAALAAKPGATVRRHELALAAWPAGAVVNDNTLDTYVSRLRRKLRAIGSDREIHTAWGVGYVLR